MTAPTRVVVAAAAVLVAIASPPPGGAAVALVSLAATVVDGAGARAWRAFRAPLFTVAVALAAQAWLAGASAALALAARVAGAGAAAAWLLATTRPDRLIAALGALGLPASVCELVALAARYVAVLGETLRTAREAQRVRLGWQRLGARARSYGALGGVVLARAVDRSVAVGEAMRARGGGRR